MGRRSRKSDFSVTEPITLDDLRWLVEQCTGMSGAARVTTKEHRDHGHPTDWDEASITVNGDLP